MVVDVMNLTEKIRLILLEELASAQARNPAYSMRSFAQKIGIGQSAVSEIVAGKRPVTRKAAEKILLGLARPPDEIEKILEGREGAVQSHAYRAIDMDSYHLIASWHHYAILSLAETKNFQSSSKWIARRLGISEKTASEAIERLLRLGLIESGKNGKLAVTGESFEAISTVANPALKKANRENLELAQTALETIAVEDRDFTALTLCFDPDRMDEARKIIKQFRRQFDRAMESGRKTEVYKLCIQLFPLSQAAHP